MNSLTVFQYSAVALMPSEYFVELQAKIKESNRYAIRVVFLSDYCKIGTRTYKIPAKALRDGKKLIEWTMQKFHQVEDIYDKQRQALFANTK